VNCDVCKAGMRKRRATRAAPYRYAFSGLPNVLLSGIDVYRCSKCRAESPVIPRVGELHAVMADALARKPARLSGEEIRFLRKNLGVSSKIFATATGIAPETLSRAEGNKQPLPLPVEQVLRGLARAQARSESAQDQLLELARLAEVRKRRKVDVVSEACAFRLTRSHGWKAAA